MLKLMWNLCKMSDNLWVKWVHNYYIKEGVLVDMNIKATHSWIMRVVLQQREKVAQMQVLWQQQLQHDKFTTKSLFEA